MDFLMKYLYKLLSSFIEIGDGGSRYLERRRSCGEPRNYEEDCERNRDEGDRGEGDCRKDRRGARILPTGGVQSQPPLLHP